MKSKLLITWITFALLFLAGCHPSPEPTEDTYGDAQPLVNQSKDDLAERLGVRSEEITVQSVEATEFPDTSLGVPEPGKMYAQVVTSGYIIRLVVGGQTYEYHGSGERVVLVPQDQ
jgi:hypothetical protein